MRDTAWREDNQHAYAGNGAQAMASRETSKWIMA
jgi:hypothetical protein